MKFLKLTVLSLIAITGTASSNMNPVQCTAECVYFSKGQSSLANELTRNSKLTTDNWTSLINQCIALIAVEKNIPVDQVVYENLPIQSSRFNELMESGKTACLPRTTRECHLIGANSKIEICGSPKLNSNGSLTVQSPSIRTLQFRPSRSLKRIICKTFGKEKHISSEKMWTKRATRVNGIDFPDSIPRVELVNSGHSFFSFRGSALKSVTCE